MRHSTEVLGLSLLLTAGSALTLASVAGASGATSGSGSGSGAGAGLTLSHHPTPPTGAVGPAPSSSPVPHSLGSKVVVPSNWSMVPSPNASASSDDNELNDVSCVTSSFCIAAGASSNGAVFGTLIEQWNGAAWSIVTSPSTSATLNILNGVSCVSSSFCVAAGYAGAGANEQTLIEQWNGVAWSIVASPDTSATLENELDAVSCVSSSFCVAAGYARNGTASQTLVEQWNGAAWSIVASPSTSPTLGNALFGVSCLSSSFCVATGYASDTGDKDQTLVEQWNGAAWSIVASPDTSTTLDNDLYSVSCVTATFCVAAGSATTSTSYVNLVEQWDGTTWSIETTPDANAAFGDALIAVDCFGPTSCAAAGYVNTINNTDDTYISEVLTWNGSSWTVVNVPEPAASTQQDEINGLSCLPGAVCIGAGYASYGSSNSQTLVLSAPITRPGYDEVASDGGIFNHGGAGFYGSLGGLTLNEPIVGMAVTPDGGGYWLVASDGGVFAKGDAHFFGSLGGLTLNKPIVGMASTPDGQGYWLVASDGGVFTEGDAGFFGSLGSLTLNKPIVGMAPTPDGRGYWLVAADGGVFAEGDAVFYGSMGGKPLNKPIVGMASTPDGRGYWLVASDGGVFTEGDAGFFGSLGSLTLNKPIVGMAPTPHGGGYWLVASDGGIFTKGDAVFSGSEGGTLLNKPVVGMGA